MKTSAPWSSAARSAGRVAFGASFFPFASAAAYGATQTFSVARMVFQDGVLLFVLAALTFAICAILGRREQGATGSGWIGLGGSLASFALQFGVLVVFAVVWSAIDHSQSQRSRTHPRVHLRSPSTSP